METIEITTPIDPKLVEFNKLKTAIDEQVKNLLLIKVTDEPSSVVANNQLSKAKQLVKSVTQAHSIVKEDALRFCQAADKAKRDMNTPLDEAMESAEKQLLAYNKIVEAKKQKDLQDLADKKKVEDDKVIAEAEALKKEMVEFEAKAFDRINKALTRDELADVFNGYVVNAPAKYDESIVARIKSLGTARFNYVVAVQNKMSGDAQAEADGIYLEMYQRLTNTKPVIKEVVLPMFDTKVQEAVIMSSGPSNIKKTWTFEVVDKAKVPMGFLMVDESAVKKWMKENPDELMNISGVVTNGIKFFQESSVKIK